MTTFSASSTQHPARLPVRGEPRLAASSVGYSCDAGHAGVTPHFSAASLRSSSQRQLRWPSAEGARASGRRDADPSPGAALIGRGIEGHGPGGRRASRPDRASAGLDRTCLRLEGDPLSDIDWIALVLLLAHVALALTTALVVSANRKPESAIAWVLTVVFIPVVGVLFFLLVGAGRLPKHRREKQAFVSNAHRDPHRGGSRRRQPPRGVAGLVGVDHAAEHQPRRAADGRREHGSPGSPTTGRHRRDGRRRRPGGPRSCTSSSSSSCTTRRPRRSSRRCARACARGVSVKVLSDHLAQFSYPNRRQTLGRPGGHGRRVPADAAAAAAEAALATTRPAQPPQAPRRRRHGRLDRARRT